MKNRLMKVFCSCLFLMFCSAAYLPVLDVSIEGITGDDSAAYAMGDRPKNPDNPGIPSHPGNGHERRHKGFPHQVPEPSTLILLAAGTAGIGIFAAIKRRGK